MKIGKKRFLTKEALRCCHQANNVQLYNVPCGGIMSPCSRLTSSEILTVLGKKLRRSCLDVF